MSFMEDPPDLDLGDDHKLWFTAFSPDRKLNPQYDGIPDCEKMGAVVSHINKDTGAQCWSGINLRTPEMEELLRRGFYKESHVWSVDKWEPLTLSPSLLCKLCGDHGFIREGKWVSC